MLISAYYNWRQRLTAAADAEWDEALLINPVYDVHETFDHSSRRRG